MIPGMDRMKRQVGSGPMSIGKQDSMPLAGPMSIGRKAGGEMPPGLREADGEASCGNCKHFTGEGCSAFGGYPCKAEQTCDAHEAKEEMGGEMPMEDEGSGEY